MQNITGINIQEHDQSKRILKINLEKDIIDKLVNAYNDKKIERIDLTKYLKRE